MGARLLGDVLEQAASLHGQRLALAEGATRLRYAETCTRVRRLAAALLGLGLRPAMHLGILAPNSHRYYEVFFASHWAGMPLAPLNTRLGTAELEFMLRDGRVCALFAGRDQLALALALRERVPGLAHVIALDGSAPDGVFDYEALLAGGNPLAAAARDWREDDCLQLCYTGGTTGRPKGVMLSHRNLLANAEHAQAVHGFRAADRWLHVAPMFHAADAWASVAMTAVGAQHHFLPGFTPDGFLDAVETEGITVTILVPTMIHAVLAHPGVRERNLRSLRLLLFGAAPMPLDRLLEAASCFGPILAQAYGLTETSPFLTLQRLEELDWSSEEGRARLRSCGRAAPGVELRVVDAEDRPLPAGEAGEVVARGPNVMLGYFRRPEETARVLRDGWLHTGDIGRLDAQGFLTLVDRAKDVIVTGGENVYSTEVESALYEHPGVREAAVIGVPDPRWGEAVHAIVVLRPGVQLDPAELIRHCHERIAGYKCPKRVTLRDAPLPKSGPGKILKSELRRPFWEGHETRLV